MARAPRPTQGGIYHVGIKSPHGLPLFRDAEDRHVFVAVLATSLVLERTRCLAFCLMTTHYHLLVDVPERRLPRFMKRLNWHYARAVNERIGGKGHVVGGRYFSVAVSDTEHLLAEYRYVVRNPVEAGLCDAPEDWAWSSHRGSIGLEPQWGLVDDRLVVDAAGGAEALRALCAVSDTERGV